MAVPALTAVNNVDHSKRQTASGPCFESCVPIGQWHQTALNNEPSIWNTDPTTIADASCRRLLAVLYPVRWHASLNVESTQQSILFPALSAGLRHDMWRITGHARPARRSAVSILVGKVKPWSVLSRIHITRCSNSSAAGGSASVPLRVRPEPEGRIVLPRMGTLPSPVSSPVMPLIKLKLSSRFR